MQKDAKLKTAIVLMQQHFVQSQVVKQRIPTTVCKSYCTFQNGPRADDWTAFTLWALLSSLNANSNDYLLLFVLSWGLLSNTNIFTFWEKYLCLAKVCLYSLKQSIHFWCAWNSLKRHPFRLSVKSAGCVIVPIDMIYMLGQPFLLS